MLLKVVLFAYSQGIVRSRAIERVCQEHVTFMALCGMTAPHVTTIAHFVSTLRDDIAQVFAAALAVCDGQGLIGREMFASDGVKLPSNVSKHRSGTRAEFAQRAERLETAAQTMLDRHRATDALELEPDVAALQVPAPIVDPDMRKRDERFADRDHHTRAPDPLHDKTRDATRARTSLPLFTPHDFAYDADARTCVCPAGKSLYRKGASNVTNGYVSEHFRGAKRDGEPCARRAQCLRTPDTTIARQVAFFRGRDPVVTETQTMGMQRQLDALEGREQYGRRFATVEPVFANIRYNKRLDRFTARGARR